LVRLAVALPVVQQQMWMAMGKEAAELRSGAIPWNFLPGRAV
jgi:hypothetical protein